MRLHVDNCEEIDKSRKNKGDWNLILHRLQEKISLKVIAFFVIVIILFYMIVTSPMIYPIIMNKTSMVHIEISNPIDGSEAPELFQVSGSININVPNGQYMWIMVNPVSDPNAWFPQSFSVVPYYGKWVQNVRIYGKSGEKFNIAVILINEFDNRLILDWITQGRDTGRFPGIPLPNSAIIKDKIVVQLVT